MSRQQRKYIVAIAIGNIGMLLIYLLGELQQTKFSGEELQSIASLSLFVPNESVFPVKCKRIVLTRKITMKVIYHPGANALNLEK